MVSTTYNHCVRRFDRALLRAAERLAASTTAFARARREVANALQRQLRGKAGDIQGEVMPIYETFSKRQKKLRSAGSPDVFQYDRIPPQFRVQIVHIMHDVLGDEASFEDEYGYGPHVREVYDYITKTLRQELGQFRLPGSHERFYPRSIAELSEYIVSEPDAEHVLDAIELICNVISEIATRQDFRGQPDAKAVSEAAILEVNHRFREHALGYRYEGEIIRVDSEIVHAEVVKPALALLQDPAFKGAEEEFRKAYDHYRKQNSKEALTEALKAFESTMKVICTKRGWPYNATDTAKNLIQTCYDKGLIPAYWQTHFSGLRSTLESGVPTPRNKLGGHGQGPAVTTVPDYLVGYALHMTAATIVFLVNAEMALP